MRSALLSLLKRLDEPIVSSTEVISWGCPILAFGDLSQSKIATLGLNPSNREFVDIDGNELDGELRRFHTLQSLGIKRWSDAESHHLKLVASYCKNYFLRNPYDGWFKSLDNIISGSHASYYHGKYTACHLDLIPYATACKWTALTKTQRSLLLNWAGDTLGLILKNSPVRILVLNGQSVVENLENLTQINLQKTVMPTWTLPRKNGNGVTGYSYKGIIGKIAGVPLSRKVLVLGFNHNIQSSFGVTTKVKVEIRDWIARTSKKVINET